MTTRDDQERAEYEQRQQEYRALWVALHDAGLIEKGMTV